MILYTENIEQSSVSKGETNNLLNSIQKYCDRILPKAPSVVISLFTMSVTKSLRDEYDELVLPAPSLSLQLSSKRNKKHNLQNIKNKIFCDR